MQFTSAHLRQILGAIAEEIERQKDHLSALDRELGDGDHGVTMSIGWQAVMKALRDVPETADCAAICQTVGMAFLNAVGSSVGPLYATAFLRAGAAVKGVDPLSAQDLLNFWTAFVGGIIERGKAKVGEKTMVDTWQPALDALRKAYEEGKDVAECFRLAAAAGKEGMLATASMVSAKGRSSRLGNRSVGHQDPGATSAYIILSTFSDQLQNLFGPQGGIG
ncbi:MAG: dihydroxyacetone kinase subunit L [Paenibacillaceae bacterium ZCTH02-B3]|nr:MAG: dihydroxyacetone kinase subunit L [Paenibacillaceae bacterium ZCTH02-B3]